MSPERKKLAPLPAALSAMVIVGAAAGEAQANGGAATDYAPGDPSVCVIKKEADLTPIETKIADGECGTVLIEQGQKMTPQEADRIALRLAQLFADRIKVVVSLNSARQAPATSGCSAEVTAPAGSRVKTRVDCDGGSSAQGGPRAVNIYGDNTGTIITGDGANTAGGNGLARERAVEPVGEPVDAVDGSVDPAVEKALARQDKIPGDLDPADWKKPPVPTNAPQYKPPVAPGAPTPAAGPSAAPSAVPQDPSLGERIKENWELALVAGFAALGAATLVVKDTFKRRKEKKERQDSLKKLRLKPEAACSPNEKLLKLLDQRINGGTPLTDTEAALFYPLDEAQVRALLKEDSTRFGIVTDPQMAERMAKAKAATNTQTQWNALLQ